MFQGLTNYSHETIKDKLYELYIEVFVINNQ